MLHTSFLTQVRAQWSMRHNPECFRGFALSYWRLVLTVLLVGTLFFLTVGAWFLWRGVSTGGIDSLQSGIPRSETLGREQLKATLELYRQRSLKFEQTKRSGSTVPDPSR